MHLPLIRFFHAEKLLNTVAAFQIASMDLAERVGNKAAAARATDPKPKMEVDKCDADTEQEAEAVQAEEMQENVAILVRKMTELLRKWEMPPPPPLSRLVSKNNNGDDDANGADFDDGDSGDHIIGGEGRRQHDALQERNVQQHYARHELNVAEYLPAMVKEMKSKLLMIVRILFPKPINPKLLIRDPVTKNFVHLYRHETIPRKHSRGPKEQQQQHGPQPIDDDALDFGCMDDQQRFHGDDDNGDGDDDGRAESKEERFCTLAWHYQKCVFVTRNPPSSGTKDVLSGNTAVAPVGVTRTFTIANECMFQPHELATASSMLTKMLFILAERNQAIVSGLDGKDDNGDHRKCANKGAAVVALGETGGAGGRAVMTGEKKLQLLETLSKMAKVELEFAKLALMETDFACKLYMDSVKASSFFSRLNAQWIASSKRQQQQRQEEQRESQAASDVASDRDDNDNVIGRCSETISKKQKKNKRMINVNTDDDAHGLVQKKGNGNGNGVDHDNKGDGNDDDDDEDENDPFCDIAKMLLTDAEKKKLEAMVQKIKFERINPVAALLHVLCFLSGHHGVRHSELVENLCVFRVTESQGLNRTMQDRYISNDFKVVHGGFNKAMAFLADMMKFQNTQEQKKEERARDHTKGRNNNNDDDDDEFFIVDRKRNVFFPRYIIKILDWIASIRTRMRHELEHTRDRFTSPVPLPAENTLNACNSAATEFLRFSCGARRGASVKEQELTASINFDCIVNALDGNVAAAKRIWMTHVLLMTDEQFEAEAKAERRARQKARLLGQTSVSSTVSAPTALSVRATTTTSSSSFTATTSSSIAQTRSIFPRFSYFVNKELDKHTFNKSDEADTEDDPDGDSDHDDRERKGTIEKGGDEDREMVVAAVEDEEEDVFKNIEFSSIGNSAKTRPKNAIKANGRGSTGRTRTTNVAANSKVNLNVVMQMAASLVAKNNRRLSAHAATRHQHR